MIDIDIFNNLLDAQINPTGLPGLADKQIEDLIKIVRLKYPTKKESEAIEINLVPKKARIGKGKYTYLVIRKGQYHIYAIEIHASSNLEVLTYCKEHEYEIILIYNTTKEEIAYHANRYNEEDLKEHFIKNWEEILDGKSKRMVPKDIFLTN